VKSTAGPAIFPSTTGKWRIHAGRLENESSERFAQDEHNRENRQILFRERRRFCSLYETFIGYSRVNVERNIKASSLSRCNDS